MVVFNSDIKIGKMVCLVDSVEKFPDKKEGMTILDY